MPPHPPLHCSASISMLFPLAVPTFLLSSWVWKQALLCGTQLNYKDLQTRPSPSHQYSSTTQARTPGFIQDLPRVLEQLLGSLIAFLHVLCTSLLFLHSAEGPEPPVAKGCMESRLHSAGFCRQHGHRAPFRPHGQRTVCHPTGNAAHLRSSLL